MLFQLAASTKEKEKRTKITTLQTGPPDKAAVIMFSSAKPKTKKAFFFSPHGISKKREQIFSLCNILASSNGYEISNILHHVLDKSPIVPGFLHTGDPAVHTRSLQGAVPCTADIVDKVIHTGESLRDTDTTTERLGWRLYLSAPLD